MIVCFARNEDEQHKLDALLNGASGSFVYYPATKKATEKRKGISCQNVGQITDELKDNVRRIYPHSFDDAGITDTLFQVTHLKKLAEAGIKREEYSMLKTKQIKIVLGDVWQMTGKYWELYPDAGISRLKVEPDELIAQRKQIGA